MKNFRRLSCALVMAMAIAPLMFSAGCKPSGGNNNDGTVVQPDPVNPPPPAKSVSEVFNLIKTCNDGTVTDDDFKKAFDALKDDDVKKLAEEKDGDNNPLHLLVKCKATANTRAVVVRYLDKIDPAVKTDQIAKKDADGNTPFALLRLAAAKRPTGEDAGELTKMKADYLTQDPDRVNDLDFDTEFTNVFKDVDTSKAKAVATKIAVGKLTGYATWAATAANKAVGQPAVKKLYPELDKPNQEALRDGVLNTLIGAGATLTAAATEIVAPTDDWGLRATAGTDVYTLPIPGAPAKIMIKAPLMYGVAKTEAVKIAAGVDTATRIAAAADLLAFSLSVRAAMNDDVAYKTMIDTTQFVPAALGAALPLPAGEEILTVTNAAFTNANTGFAYHYLDMPNVSEGVRLALASADVSGADAKAIYDAAITPRGFAAELGGLAPAGSAIQSIVRRAASAEVLGLMTTYFNELGAAEATAQMTLAGGGLKPLIRLVDAGNRVTNRVGPVAADGAELADMIKLGLAAAANAEINEMRPAQFEARVDAQYAVLAGAGKTEFGALYDKADAGNKKIMRSKLANLAIAAYPATVTAITDLVAAITAPGNALKLATDMDTVDYDLSVNGVAVNNATLLFGLAKVIETVAGANIDHMLAWSKAISGAVNDDVKYKALALTAVPSINTKLIPAKTGFAPYYLNMPEADVFAGVLAAAADTANVSSADLETLVNNVVTGATANAIADRLSQVADVATGNRIMHYVTSVRPAVKETVAIAEKIFTGAEAATAGNGLQRLMDGNKAGTKPFLAIMSNARPAGDVPASLTNLRVGALKFVDTATFDTLTEPNVQDVVKGLYADFGGAGAAAAKKAFKDTFGKTAVHKSAMASQLVNSAYATAGGAVAVVAAVNAIVTDITDAADVLGLKGSVGTLEYKINKLDATTGTHDGTLLHALVERAVEDKVGNTTVAAVATAYNDFRTRAVAIKAALTDAKYYTLVNTKLPGGSSMFELFDAELKTANLNGYAAYYFDMDVALQIAGVMEAVETKTVASADVLALYDLVSAAPNKQAHSVLLAAALGVTSKDDFINTVVLRDIDASIKKLVVDVLAAVKPSSPGADLALVAASGATSRTNVLQKLVSNKRTDKGSKPLKELMAHLVDIDDGTAIGKVSTPTGATNMMTAVKEAGTKDNLRKAFEFLGAKHKAPVLAYAMTYRADTVPSAGGAVNDVLSAARDSAVFGNGDLINEVTRGGDFKKVLFYVQVLAHDAPTALATAQLDIGKGVKLVNSIASVKPQTAKTVEALQYLLASLDAANWVAVRDDVLPGSTDTATVILKANGAIHGGKDDAEKALLLFEDATGKAQPAKPAAAPAITNEAP